MQMLAPSAAQKGPDLHEQVSAVARQFTQAVQQGKFDAALALTAKSYRESASVEQFTAVCKSSPYLATVKEIRFFRVSQQSIPLADGKMASGPATATGLLVADSGNVDVTVSFAAEGSDFRILSILAAGVPIFQGVTAVAVTSASASAAPPAHSAPVHHAAKSAKPH
jgi:hypothetical protein